MADLDNDLPADEGHQAFRDRKTPDDNPYKLDDWRHKATKCVAMSSKIDVRYFLN